MLNFIYNAKVDVYRRAGSLNSGSYSYSINELNEPQYGDTYTNWQKISASAYARIENKLKQTQYLQTGERTKGTFTIYMDKSASHLWQQDRVVDTGTPRGGSPSMYVIDWITDNFDQMGNVQYYEIQATTP